MLKYLKIFLLGAAIMAAVAPQRAQAIDPVTIAILAPIALQAAEAARPYVIRGMINFGKGLLKVGKASLELFFIPYGLFKMVFLSPWGEFRSGVVYTIRGGMGLGKMLLHTLLLPVYMCGVEINMASNL
ncbi:MAG: hypothetical protein J6Y54_05350 [Lentisphaeria bacterium]|jgi:hypothetical protein|nr:hypothetical protein [Lentisphaeria bacterium]